jgi:hypothetical protein
MNLPGAFILMLKYYLLLSWLVVLLSVQGPAPSCGRQAGPCAFVPVFSSWYRLLLVLAARMAKGAAVSRLHTIHLHTIHLHIIHLHTIHLHTIHLHTIHLHTIHLHTIHLHTYCPQSTICLCETQHNVDLKIVFG